MYKRQSLFRKITWPLDVACLKFANVLTRIDRWFQDQYGASFQDKLRFSERAARYIADAYMEACNERLRRQAGGSLSLSGNPAAALGGSGATIKARFTEEAVNASHIFWPNQSRMAVEQMVLMFQATEMFQALTCQTLSRRCFIRQCTNLGR